ncbi:ABC transporter ATP-binding protein [Jiangella mangrovi]|uniref:ABC-type quaternary amine transporter n=1 Tax=Jiangella mangrovi TaxID=1524084 RepID=A0A7W9GXQ2_9ACTN|nr:ABC transporter ATP-binding protein [Jiangella mangrovi]MBB5791944.1 iron(III) transport system ATP-binding protein [Jiangella mangrovi]
MTTLSLAGVSKSFGRVPVLHDVSLTVAAGTRTAVVGASGSGKSTLLRLIAGFERADAGSITLGATTLAAPGRFVPAHRRGIGYVAQDGALFPHLTVEQNIRFGLPRRSRAREDLPARVREVMELASLDAALARRYPHQLSGGQQQRVALARALAPRPEVVLLDEPFSALDTGLREQTRQAVIDALEHSVVTTVLVTHDHDEALSFGRQIAVIADGHLVQSGAPSAVFDNPVSTEIAAFLGAAIVLPAEVVGSSGDVDCALGRVAVRHDRRDGVGRADARLLLRPAQLEVSAANGTHNAVVEDVRARGSHAELLLRPAAGGGGAALIPLRVPAHEGPAYQTGMKVSVIVTGGGVLYPGD